MSLFWDNLILIKVRFFKSIICPNNKAKINRQHSVMRNLHPLKKHLSGSARIKLT